MARENNYGITVTVKLRAPTAQEAERKLLDILFQTKQITDAHITNTGLIIDLNELDEEEPKA